MYTCIIDLMDMSLSKLREMVKDRGAWCAVVGGIAESGTAERLNNSRADSLCCTVETNNTVKRLYSNTN